MRETITVHTCDRCGQRADVPISFRIHVGHVAGAVGREDDIKTIDLCGGCVGVALQRIANACDNFEEAKELVSAAMDKKPLTRLEQEGHAN